MFYRTSLTAYLRKRLDYMAFMNTQSFPHSITSSLSLRGLPVSESSCVSRPWRRRLPTKVSYVILYAYRARCSRRARPKGPSRTSSRPYFCIECLMRVRRKLCDATAWPVVGPFGFRRLCRTKGRMLETVDIPGARRYRKPWGSVYRPYSQRGRRDKTRLATRQVDGTQAQGQKRGEGIECVRTRRKER